MGSTSRMASCFVLVLAMIKAIHGQTPPQATPSPVCFNLKTGSAIPRIDLDNEFSVRMEMVAQESNRVTNIRMFYSQDRNQIRLQSLDDGVRSDTYFYFADNEILTFNYTKDSSRGSCTVNSDLANAADTFVVGGSKNNTVKVPLAVLHLIGQSGFGSEEIKLQKVGTGTNRDMDVDIYNSCQKWTIGPLSAIVNVTHYLSSKSWARPYPAIIPVSIEIKGSAVIHNQVHPIQHVYNFFDFQSSVDATVFETPPGIMCQGRNVDVPFPKAPGYIQFSGETIDPNDLSVGYFEEIYDADDDFAVLRSQSMLDYGSQGGMNEIMIIRDYQSGLSYTIDRNTQSCTTLNISRTPQMPFDYINPQGKAQEISPEQLFFMDNAKYEYIGERTVRGILSDTWVTKTTVPTFPNDEVTVEWYFAKPDVTSWNSGSTDYQIQQYRMPVLLRMWLNDDAVQSLDTNIYHVDYTKIMYGVVDIRDCYPERPSNYFQIVLNGAKEMVMNTNIEQFKWSTARAIAFIAGVRLIRIADLQVYYDINDAVIEFELLDAPPYASDIDTPYPALSLQEATQRINDAVTSGNMIIKVWNSATNEIDKGIIASRSVKISANNAVSDNGDSGYSAGSMAGLGIAMVIIGGAGGGIGAHFIIK